MKARRGLRRGENFWLRQLLQPARSASFWALLKEMYKIPVIVQTKHAIFGYNLGFNQPRNVA